MKKDLIKAVKNYPLIFLAAETGSGKSTVVPIHLMQEFYKSFKTDGIAVSQPRQINAMEISEWVAKQLDVPLGDHVGYAHRYDKKFKKEKTKLRYLTDGYLLQELYRDPDKYDFVLIDEVHTRSPYIDIILYLIKHKPGKNTKYILMSATLNIPQLEKYFKDAKYKTFSISGRSYPIKNYFENKDIDTKKTFESLEGKLLDICKDKKDDKDILVFLPSKSSIKKMKRFIDEYKDSDAFTGMFAIELWAGMDPTKEKIATDRFFWKSLSFNVLESKYKIVYHHDTTKKKGFRGKIILSTNVAETGLTVDGVTRVLETGLEVKSDYNNEKDLIILAIDYIDQSSARQRCGRAGRIEPGECHHIYSESQFKKMKEYPLPAIHREDIAPVLLNLYKIAKSDKDIIKIMENLIEPINPDIIINTFKYRIIEAIGNDGKLSTLGNLSLHLRLNIPQTKTLLLAYIEGVFHPVAAILGYMAVEDSIDKFFILPKNKKLGRDVFKSLYCEKGSLYAYYTFYKKISYNNLNKYTKEHYMNLKKVKNALRNTRNLKMLFNDIKGKYDIKQVLSGGSNSPPSEYRKILRVFKRGFNSHRIIKMASVYITEKFKVIIEDNMDPFLNARARLSTGMNYIQAMNIGGKNMINFGF
ncbi:MAG: helicase-related protein [bacterium]